MKKISWEEAKEYLRNFNRERGYEVGNVGNEIAHVAVVFTADSFQTEYSEESRTYIVPSNNKAFIEGMMGYSIFASCLDGTDKCVRIEGYMASERGGEDGWKVDYCYIKD